MSRGWLRAVATVSSVAIVMSFGIDPTAAEGNAGLHLHKTVDPLQLAINPGIGVTLAVDKSAAIPGDDLTYTSVVTNPTVTFTMGGYVNAEAVASADATVAYYWDELDVCGQGCGTGAANPHWTPVATFEAGQPGYTPVTPPAKHDGMTLAAQSVSRPGVTYPSTGDAILGTVMNPKATATWTYLSKVVLTPAQVAAISNPALVTSIRNVLHFEVSVRNTTAAQPYTDPEEFTSPFTSVANPGAISNVTVTFTLPDGSTAVVGPAQVPALATLSPGGSATATAHYRVPVPAPKGPSEGDRRYAARLGALDGSALHTTAVASGSGFSGPVYAAAPAVPTVENLPIVTIVKAGPPEINAGDTETNPLTLSNDGGATASALAVVDSVPGGANGSVSPLPGTLAPGASVRATASFPVPISQSEGDLTDTASVTWNDANSNPYGPLSSSFTTRVHNLFFSAALTLSPANAGPNPPGTTQTLTATLLDRNGNPIPSQPVRFDITGANPGTGTATTSAIGVAEFTYTGTNAGIDVAQATVTAPGITLTSNTASISWGRPVQPIVTTQVQGNFFPNPNNTCTFGAGPTSTPAFGQTFPDILFNPPPTSVPHDISSVNQSTRPFTDLTVDVNGNYNGQIVAQGNGVQAGSGSLSNFYAVFTGSFVATQAGDVTFTILHDDGYILGVGNGATRVNGDFEGNPPATTPFNNYGVVAGWNQAGTGQSGTATVHFPAPGTYPYELDYTECGAGPLFLVLETAQFIAQTDPLSVYVGYADGLRAGGSIFPFPWEGSPGVTFVGGCTFDAGALRFDNSGDTDITFDKVTVDIPGAVHFDFWPASLVVPAHGILILTQTGCYNFDTSDYSNAGCGGNNNVQPLVNVTRAGVTTTYTDTHQILNTRGFDLACQGNESTPWQRIAGQANTINTPLPPGAVLDISPFTVAGALLGQNQALTVSAMDAAGNPVANLPVTLQVFGPNARTLSATTLATGLAVFGYVGSASGTDSVQASAFIGGLRAISNLGSVSWSAPVGGGPNPSPNPDPNAPPPPSITAPSPPDGTVVTKPVSITATIAPPAGQTIASWRVFYQALDPGPVVVIASGTGAPPPALATFDPTLLPNDTYGITVEATASGGGIQDVTTTVAVLGNLKPGRYTATYQDLAVPVNGFSMEVRRSYDSFDKALGDFGVGWNVSVVNFRTAPNHVLGAGGWTMYNKQCFIGLCLTGYKDSAPRFVSVVFPDQHTELFNFTPDGGTNIFWDCTPLFTAQGAQGTTSTLVPIDDAACSYVGDGNLYGSHGLYDPQRFQLTTRDGQVFVLDRHSGLISETDTHGNTVSIDSSGVHSTTGGSITYTRDASGRITKITGPAGEAFNYAYSSAGDLASVTDPRGAVTTFTYAANHNLTATNGPGGQPLVSATYDVNGRVTALTDATGQTVHITNDVPGQQEVITDPTGETFIATLSDRGDLLSQAEIGDGHTNTYSFTYDSVGRQLSATDPLGNTRTLTYDSAGDLLTSSDPKGRKSTMTYGSSGQLLTFTDPAGGVTTYTWDAAINLISVTDPTGATTTYTYDSAGNRTSDRSPLGAITSYTYDTAGRLLTRTDPLNHVTTYTYDASGRMLTVTDPAGNRTANTYDADGLLASSTDPAGATTTYVHDALGRVTSARDALGRTTTYTYDGNGRMTAKTDPLGGRTSYTYDASGRVLTETDPAGGQLTYAYDGHGRAITLTDAIGRVTRRAYDDAGNLVSETNPAGGVTAYAYGTDGLKSSTTDPLGRVTSSTYDARGQLATQTNPLGQRTTYAYDAMGRVTTVTDPLGATTRYTYDAAGQRLTQTDALGGVTTYQYDAAGRQTAIIDPTGRTSGFTYDLAGNLASTTDSAGHTTSYRYDADGRQTQITTALGRITTSTYDSASQLVSRIDPLGNVTRYTYDAGGRRVTETSPRGGVTTTAYDAAGRPIRVTDALAANVNFAYDAAGQRTSITDPAGHVTTFTYGPLGGVASRTFPWGGTQSYTYDAAGQRTSETNARGTTATYSYDAGGHVVRLAVTGGGFTQSFDGGGRRSSFTDATGTTSFTYDADGRTTSVAAPAGTIGYTYDAAGRQASQTLPGTRTTTYGYDTGGLLASAGDWTGATITFSHDADGELTSITRPGSVTTFAYDAAGRTTAISDTSGSTTIDAFRYTYDADGNRTSMASNAGTESYTIDLAGRLTGVGYPDGSTAVYNYDAAGNRTSSVVAGVTTAYTYDSSGRLASAGSTSIGYDADGNQVSKGADSFSYDWAGRLTAATVGGVGNTYTYNADGARVAISRGPVNTNFLVDESSGVAQVVGDGANSYVRDPSGALLEWRNQAGAATSPLADALGSVRYQTDATGAVTGTAAYGAFGDARSHTGASSPFGFTGEPADPTGLLYLRARYYDPTLGRFTSPDSLDVSGPGALGSNRYVYAADNPTTLTDPSGHQATLELRLIAGVFAIYGAYLLWQIGRQIIWILQHSCIYRGNCYSAPAAVAPGAGVVARPLTRPIGQPFDKQAFKELVRDAVALCAAAGTYGALAGGGANNPCNLLPVDVFYVGVDLWDVTKHDLDAIAKHPFEWDVLTKSINPRTTTNRTWYNNEPTCSDEERKKNPGMACDEYPFYTTEEGGPQLLPDNLGADLKLLDPVQNSTQGARLKAFTDRCQIPNGDVYVVAPGPITRGVCKRP